MITTQSRSLPHLHCEGEKQKRGEGGQEVPTTANLNSIRHSGGLVRRKSIRRVLVNEKSMLGLADMHTAADTLTDSRCTESR